MSAEPIRVFIAEDHPLYRDGVTRMLGQRDAFEVVGEAEDGQLALDAMRELRPDVALVDIAMPGLDGLGVLDAIKRDELDIKVVLLSGALENQVVYRALAAGADGILSKTEGPDAVADAILAVVEGRTVLPPDLHSGLAEEIRKRGVDTGPHLSGRELEVLKLTAEGCSATDIAERLSISSGTVKTHLQNAYQKLGVSDRAAAVAEAMRRGLIE
jgi:two-component system nitrate/nitrite response regulator NarL